RLAGLALPARLSLRLPRLSARRRRSARPSDQSGAAGRSRAEDARADGCEAAAAEGDQDADDGAGRALIVEIWSRRRRRQARCDGVECSSTPSAAKVKSLVSFKEDRVMKRRLTPVWTIALCLVAVQSAVGDEPQVMMTLTLIERTTQVN